MNVNGASANLSNEFSGLSTLGNYIQPVNVSIQNIQTSSNPLSSASAQSVGGAFSISTQDPTDNALNSLLSGNIGSGQFSTQNGQLSFTTSELDLTGGSLRSAFYGDRGSMSLTGSSTATAVYQTVNQTRNEVRNATRKETVSATRQEVRTAERTVYSNGVVGSQYQQTGTRKENYAESVFQRQETYQSDSRTEQYQEWGQTDSRWESFCPVISKACFLGSTPQVEKPVFGWITLTRQVPVFSVRDIYANVTRTRDVPVFAWVDIYGQVPRQETYQHNVDVPYTYQVDVPYTYTEQVTYQTSELVGYNWASDLLYGSIWGESPPTQPVPEPATMLLLGSALGAGALRRRLKLAA